MPKQTFWNLPDDKRTAIIETAINEFAENDYQSASISRMVAHLGIAKGSFYQYFADKQDLYQYILDFAMQERMAFVGQQTPIEQGFFAYTQALLETGLRYDLSHPQLSRIVYRALVGPETAAPFRAAMLRHQREILQMGVDAGEIDPSINLDLAAHMLNTLMGDFASFLVEHLKLDPKRLTDGDYSEQDMMQVRDLLGQMTRILQYGLAKR